MRVRVLDDRCQGHTLCFGVAPEVFGLREEDGHSYVIDEEVAPDHEESARHAALGCPEQAIEIVDG